MILLINHPFSQKLTNSKISFLNLHKNSVVYKNKKHNKGVFVQLVIMSNVLSPVVAGAGLAFSLLFLMALANGATALVFGTSVEDYVNSKMPAGGQ